ncbi:MAG: hypothetical protein IMF08_11070 [Proteobacteria bacterium]|nr:hypothetical protein [Pseudomonadota bacterium]MCK4869252.1 hypothetical protein [Alphaproteobacteria bacterium]
MRRIAVITIMFLALLAMVPPAGAQGFFELLEDVPVMPALAPVADAGIEFDAPSGRIVEAYAIGATDRQSVLDFYRATLPQLGWQAGAGDAFLRESESLKIDFFGPDGEITVRFTVAPATSGG